MTSRVPLMSESRSKKVPMRPTISRIGYLGFFTRHLVEVGRLSARDALALKDAEVAAIFLAELDEREIVLVIDYTQDILQLARAALENSRNYESVTAYAMLFEHKLNLIISALCTRANMSEDAINRLMRFDLSDKGTWILELLGCGPVESEIRER